MERKIRTILITNLGGIQSNVERRRQLKERRFHASAHGREGGGGSFLEGGRERERSGEFFFFFSTGIDSRRRIIRYRYRNPICKRHTQGLVTLIGDHARRLTMVVGDTRWPADNGPPCTDADRIAGSVERIRGVTEHYFNAPAFANAVAIPPWLKHGLLRKDISRKIIYLFLHRCLISRREDFFLIDRGISSIGRKKFTERKIVRRKGEQHVLGIPCVSLRQLQISCDGNPTKSTRAVHACRVRGSHLACAWPPWIIAARHFRNSKLCPFPISLAYSFENPAFIYNTPALSFKLLGNWRVLSWLNENQGNKNNRIFVGYGYQK